MKNLKWKIIFVLVVLLGALYVALTKPINLGLDLGGGTHLVLQIDVEKALESETSAAAREIKRLLEEEGIPVVSVKREGTSITVTLLSSQELPKAVKLIKEDYGNMFSVKEEGKSLILTLKPEYASKEVDRLAEQALETIRNRVDELGVAEPVIVRNGKDRIIGAPGDKKP